MYKLVVFFAVICAANAGIISTGLGLGGIGIAAPVAVAAPVAYKTAVATSYQNGNQISLNPTPVVAQTRVAVAHAPIAVAHAPIAVHAPVAVAAPIATVGVSNLGLGLGLGRIEGLGLGGIGLKGI